MYIYAYMRGVLFHGGQELFVFFEEGLVEFAQFLVCALDLLQFLLKLLLLLGVGMRCGS